MPQRVLSNLSLKGAWAVARFAFIYFGRALDWREDLLQDVCVCGASVMSPGITIAGFAAIGTT